MAKQQPHPWVDEIAASLATDIVEGEEQKELQILSKQAETERVKLQIREALVETQQKVENGAKIISETLPKLVATHPEISLNNIAADFDRVMQFFATLDQHMDQYIGGLMAGTSIYKICHISDATMEALYQGTKYLYENQCYEEASNALSFLTILDSQNYVFWMLLGNAEFFRKNYQTALVAYAMVALVDPTQFACHLYSSKCYEETNDLDLAINALDVALAVLDVIKNDPSQDPRKIKNEITPTIMRERERLLNKQRGRK